MYAQGWVGSGPHRHVGESIVRPMDRSIGRTRRVCDYVFVLELGLFNASVHLHTRTPTPPHPKTTARHRQLAAIAEQQQQQQQQQRLPVGAAAGGRGGDRGRHGGARPRGHTVDAHARGGGLRGDDPHPLGQQQGGWDGWGRPFGGAWWLGGGSVRSSSLGGAFTDAHTQICLFVQVEDAIDIFGRMLKRGFRPSSEVCRWAFHSW